MARRDADLIDAFGVDDVRGSELEPSWIVAPRQDVRIVLEQLKKDDAGESAGHHLRTARWGLVPSWAKDPAIGSRLINARSETITEKPSCKAAAGKWRCIVPADGYYEWQKLDEAGKKKQPYYLHANDEAPLAFAGLYEWWRDPELPDDHPDKWRCTNTMVIRRGEPIPVTFLVDHVLAGLSDPAVDVRVLLALSVACPSPTLVSGEHAVVIAAPVCLIRLSGSSTQREPSDGRRWLRFALVLSRSSRWRPAAMRFPRVQ